MADRQDHGFRIKDGWLWKDSIQLCLLRPTQEGWKIVGSSMTDLRAAGYENLRAMKAAAQPVLRQLPEAKYFDNHPSPKTAPAEDGRSERPEGALTDLTATEKCSPAREPDSYVNQFSDLVAEGVRTLQAADADGIPKSWWTGNVRRSALGGQGFGSEIWVGCLFDLFDGSFKIGRYRVVAVALAPEGYFSVVAYGEIGQPDAAPKIDVASMLVK